MTRPFAKMLSRALCFAAVLGGADAADDPRPVPDDVRRVFDEAAPPRAGLVIGDGHGRVFVHEKGGFDLDERHRLASGTKLLSAITILMVVESGEMSLEDNPQDHLPYWTRDPADPRSRVTLSHLLGFTSGFGAPPNNDGCLGDPRTTLQACVRQLYRDGLDTEPGTVFAYGPEHLQIAAAMTERATGTGFADLFDERIAGPLGLTRTGFVRPSRANPKAASGAWSTGHEYAAILAALLEGRLLSDLGPLTADRTAGAEMGVLIPAAEETGDWHYAAGAWLECDDDVFSARCAENPVISSPGALGWLPWIDLADDHYGLIAAEARGRGQPGPSVQSVRTEQALQPLIKDRLSRGGQRRYGPGRERR